MQFHQGLCWQGCRRPVHRHPELSRNASDAGVHIFCEHLLRVHLGRKNSFSSVILRQLWIEPASSVPVVMHLLFIYQMLCKRLLCSSGLDSPLHSADHCLQPHGYSGSNLISPGLFSDTPSLTLKTSAFIIVPIKWLIIHLSILKIN